MDRQVFITVSPKEAMEIGNECQTALLRFWNLGSYVGWVNCYVAKKHPILINKGHVDEFYNLVSGDAAVYAKEALLYEVLNGKVIFRFWHDGYIPFTWHHYGYRHQLHGLDHLVQGIDQRLKLGLGEIGKLIKFDQSKILFALCFNKLEIFEKPKALSDFQQFYGGEESFYELKKAPSKYTWVYPKDESYGN